MVFTGNSRVRLVGVSSQKTQWRAVDLFYMVSKGLPSAVLTTSHAILLWKIVFLFKRFTKKSYFDVISNILMNVLHLRKSYHVYSDFCVYVCSSCVCVLLCAHVVGGQRWTWGVFLDCTPPYFLRQGVHRACSSMFQLGWLACELEEIPADPDLGSEMLAALCGCHGPS